MPSATVPLEAAPLHAAAFLFALGPRRIVVGLVRLLADRIENGGWAPPPIDIDLAIRRLPKTAYAAKTRRVYAGVLRALNEWLDGRPATDALLARYLGVLFDRGRAPPSAVHLVAAVHYAAKECARAGLRSTDPVGPATNERLERFHRDGAERGTGQVRAISWKEAKKMCRRAEAPDDLAGKRDAAIISCASDALLRVAEVSALNVDDVTFLADGTARIRIRRSKTRSARPRRGAVPACAHGQPPADLDECRPHRVRRPVPGGGPVGARLGTASRAGLGPRRDQAPCEGGRDRGPGVRPLAADRLGAGAGRAGHVARRAAEGGTLEGSVHAGALHTQPGGVPGRRGAAARRSPRRRRCLEKVEKSACGVRKSGGRVRITRVKRMILLYILEDYR